MKARPPVEGAYLKYQAELDAFMKAKDASQLIGIYELTEPGGFANEPPEGVHARLPRVRLALHQAARDRERERGPREAGRGPGKNLGAKLDDLSPARETIMWQKIQAAKGYLLVGMGDAHRKAPGEAAQRRRDPAQPGRPGDAQAEGGHQEGVGVVTASDADRERAAELAAEARELLERQEYRQARPLYEESLRLHEDAEVREAYHLLLSAIGPM